MGKLKTFFMPTYTPTCKQLFNKDLAANLEMAFTESADDIMSLDSPIREAAIEILKNAVLTEVRKQYTSRAKHDTPIGKYKPVFASSYYAQKTWLEKNNSGEITEMTFQGL